MRRLAIPALAASALLAGPGEAGAALRFQSCGDFEFSCARLSAPLDRSGAVPGRVSLYVKRKRAARRARRGALFMLAGGPGQSATDAFDGDALGVLGPALRKRDLIVFDQRGTGRSGLLRCRRLERANLLDAGTAAAACAARIGPRRAFYTTRDSVEDIDAIRRELGVERIALFGTSYGTKVALAYALAYPGNVERLALDSVVEADGPDALYLDAFAAVPRALRSLCRGACRRITRDPVADVEALSARLAARPLHGVVVNARGRRRSGRLSRAGVFTVLVAGDFDPALRAAFPAAVASALRGDAAPMLRLRRRALALDGEPPPPRSLSAAVYAATTCEELRLPWARTAPPSERRAQAAAAASSLPDSAFRPFDRQTALDNDLLALCEGWPAAPVEPALAAGPLPDVPVLLLAGEDDLRTPVESARRVAAEFPRARLFVPAATGHSALGSDPSGCAERVFGRFFAGRRLPLRCPRRRRDLRPAPIAPASLRKLKPARGVRGARGRALTALALTLRDVTEDSFTSLILDFKVPDLARGGGLRGGRYRIDADGVLRLRRVEYVPGVRVSGRLRHFGERRQSGRLHVGGRASPDGVLRLRGNRVRGRLGGRRVRGRLRPDASVVDDLVARAARLPRPG